MIKFSGNLSEECKKVLGKSQLRYSAIGGWITALLFSIIVTVLTIKCSTLYALFYSVCILSGVASSVPINKKYRERVCPNIIVIENNVITSSGEHFFQERNVEDIKRIDDFGNYYRILFLFPHQSPLFLCQKDLLADGTIEEFEERFADLIVRKEKR